MIFFVMNVFGNRRVLLLLIITYFVFRCAYAATISPSEVVIVSDAGKPVSASLVLEDEAKGKEFFGQIGICSPLCVIRENGYGLETHGRDDVMIVGTHVDTLVRTDTLNAHDGAVWQINVDDSCYGYQSKPCDFNLIYQPGNAASSNAELFVVYTYDVITVDEDYRELIIPVTGINKQYLSGLKVDKNNIAGYEGETKSISISRLGNEQQLSLPLKVSVSVLIGDANVTAQNTDFTMSETELIWQKGDGSTKQIILKLLEDELQEQNEIFVVRLNSVEAAENYIHESVDISLKIHGNREPILNF